MITGEFEYFAPTTVQEALSLLTQHGHGAKILAGGQSLIPAMRFRLSLPETIIDINKLTDLQYIREDGTSLIIGALTRESMLEQSDIVKRYPMLEDASHVIADPIVRNMATVGGNLAHADPANDHPAVMLAYGAQVVAVGPKGSRTIAIDDFFTGLFENALSSDEILTEIRIPKPAPHSGSAYLKMERKVGDYAISAAAVNLTMNGSTVSAARIGLTNVNSVPMRAKNAEQALIGKALTDDVIEAAGKAAAAECDPSADLRGSVAYKRDITRVLTKRAIRAAQKRVS